MRTLLVSLAFAVSILAQTGPDAEECQTYNAYGHAGVTLTMSYPGNPACVAGSVTNALPWHGSTVGTAVCPLQFVVSTKTWTYQPTYTSDYDGGSSGAGCWNGSGPEVFNRGTVDCSISGDICQEAFVTVLGQYIGVQPVGVYYAGATYYFGDTACWPASATYKYCWIPTPIIIDVDGGGYKLTSAAGGVKFDFYGTGDPIQLSWTAEGSTNGFLVLPRNGTVTNGMEMFGDLTLQPICDNPNGFAALAGYDANGDGVINAEDPVWSKLRLWVDANHDGVAQPEELHTLESLGIRAISIKYDTEGRVDQYGNRFRYRARVWDEAGEKEKWAYDVILVKGQ